MSLQPLSVSALLQQSVFCGVFSSLCCSRCSRRLHLLAVYHCSCCCFTLVFCIFFLFKLVARDLLLFIVCVFFFFFLHFRMYIQDITVTYR